MPLPPAGPFSLYATANGDGSGTYEVNENYETSTRIYLQGVDNKSVYVRRLMFTIGVRGSFSPFGYGGTHPLDNSIQFKANTASYGEIDLVAAPIFSHADWAAHMHDWELRHFGPNEFVTARWSLDRFVTNGVLLESSSDYIEIWLHGDFTPLTHHRFMFQGEVLEPDTNPADNGGPMSVTIANTSLDVSVLNPSFDVNVDNDVDVNILNTPIGVNIIP